MHNPTVNCILLFAFSILTMEDDAD